MTEQAGQAGLGNYPGGRGGGRLGKGEGWMGEGEVKWGLGAGEAGAFVTWPKMLSVIIPPISASIEKTMNIRNSLRGE